jgi:hypothetical protein
VGLNGLPAGADVGDAAARAIELGDFQRIIADDYDNCRELDRKAPVRLAMRSA